MEKYSILRTDLYQLKMAAGYFENNQHETIVTFEGFVRKLPEKRNFLVVSGLSLVLDYIKNISIADEEIEYLKNLPEFTNINPKFFEYLKGLKITCDVDAVPEGTILFSETPFISITGKLLEVQLIETLLLSYLNFSTSVSSKAARIYSVINNKTKLSEFGFRRAHGPGAANIASRAAIIGGFNSTSNVQAGLQYGISLAGTQAHSYIMSFPTEEEAFVQYLKTYPNSCSLLIDTYDPIQGTLTAIKVAGKALKSVRLDSGDKIFLSKKIRKLLDEAGLEATQIVVSDDMNEHKIGTLMKFDCPIDVFGVGTELVTSKDEPALGGVYKLVEITGPNGLEYKAKGSEKKTTLPGKKQVYREFREGKAFKDHLHLYSEAAPIVDGEISPGLLLRVMEKGNVLYNETLTQMRERFISSLEKLPSKYLSVDNNFHYDVVPSKTINEILETILKKNKCN